MGLHAAIGVGTEIMNDIFDRYKEKENIGRNTNSQWRNARSAPLSAKLKAPKHLGPREILSISLDTIVSQFLC